jgi:excisionase family DNA binding protein
MTAPQQYDPLVYTRQLGRPTLSRPPTPRPADPPQMVFLTVAEIADRLRVSKMTIYRLIHHGEMQAKRVGRSLRVSTVALAAYMTTVDTVDGDDG